MPNDFLEKNLEDIIYENKDLIHTRGLPRFYKKVFRQVLLPSGRIIDILSFEIDGAILKYSIWELKKDVVNIYTACQAHGYVNEINQLVRNHFLEIKPSMVLIGKKYDTISIFSICSTPILVYTYEYKLDGVFFCNHPNTQQVYEPNDNFSLGLWGIGSNFISDASNGRKAIHYGITTTVVDEIRQHCKRVIENETPKAPIEMPAPIKGITTEIFPPQPAWSLDFSSAIPYSDDLLEDFDIDEADYEEGEDLELDGDDEINGDMEPDTELEPCSKLSTEPILIRDFKITELCVPDHYYIKPLALSGDVINWRYMGDDYMDDEY